MAQIYQKSFFSWKDLDDLGDLKRLKLVIDTMPDQKLVRTLREIRGNGRNDHPPTAMWNSVLAGIVYQHQSIESLRRELKRNAQLRELCGFNPIKGVKAVLSKSVYHRFLKQLLKHKKLIES